MATPFVSPFPGMDPYLEQFWRDVHQRLITYACDQLQLKLPPSLRGRLDERVFVENESGNGRTIYPDMHVVERPSHPVAETAAASTAGSAVAVAEPLIIHIHDEPIRQGYIEIVEAGSGNRVVTVIEFLSPSNKMPGDGQKLYLAKQREVRAGGTNLVEIDLTRAGRRMLMIDPLRIPQRHRTTYQVCVWRACKPDCVEVYRAPLQEALPTIRVPLRETDADAVLELQPLVDQCYRNGRYEDLDYRAQPEPPLEGPDAAWARELLADRELR